MKALLAAQDRGGGGGWYLHRWQAPEQPGSSATERFCAKTLKSQGKELELPGPWRLSEPRVLRRVLQRHASKKWEAAALQRSLSSYLHLLFIHSHCLNTCLLPLVRKTEASIHRSCSCSHNSDYLCTASRARYRQWSGGEEWKYSPEHNSCICAASHTVTWPRLWEQHQRVSPDTGLLISQSITAVKQRILVFYSLLAVAQLTLLVNEM